MQDIQNANDAQQKVKVIRDLEIARLKRELAELYRFLMIDYRDRKTFPNTPTAVNLQAIETELKAVESQADATLNVHLAKYEKRSNASAKIRQS
jgi:hypothetical protein